MIETYLSLSGADINTSVGDSIIAITYDTRAKEGTLLYKVFMSNIDLMNVMIVYKNEYDKLIYKRLMGVQINKVEGEPIKSFEAYTFKFSDVITKTI